MRGSSALCGWLPYGSSASRHPGGAQLLQRAAGGAGEPGLLPDLGGEAQGGGLLGVQGDRRQPVAVAAGEVADVAVEALHRLDDQAELAQIVLVPLEHPVEGVVTGGRGEAAGRARVRIPVGLDGSPQLTLAERAPGPQQAQRQIHQPLGLGNRHRRPFSL